MMWMIFQTIEFLLLGYPLFSTEDLGNLVDILADM